MSNQITNQTLTTLVDKICSTEQEREKLASRILTETTVAVEAITSALEQAKQMTPKDKSLTEAIAACQNSIKVVGLGTALLNGTRSEQAQQLEELKKYITEA